ncbi:HTH domain-containing protein [Gracilibacillus sp. JCM 18860]|uniref:HTH domain-containing protein n=1 Tax=Gracilibacillus sp. JCM 18860 TaxID=1306159 RepID=UPI0006CFC669
MHKKHSQLINFLMNQDQEYVSTATLAEILNVTDRTIRNYIKEINDSGTDIIITSSSQGYAIKNDNTRIDQEWFVSDEKELEEAFLEFQIIQFLMNESEYITYDEIADRFFYSPQTIRSRLQKLTMNIQALGIDVAIDTKVFKGIKLIGTELQKRVLLESFFSSITVKKEVYKDYVINGFRTWIDVNIIESIFKLVDEINIKYQLNLEFLMYKKMTTQLIIIIHQINLGHTVSIEDTELDNLTSFREYEVAEAFRSRINKYVNMTDDEIIYFVNYLISLQLDLDNTQIGNKNHQIISKIEDILLQVEQVYQVPTYSQKRFRNNISNHIYRIIYPASHNLLIYNPFVKETKSEYFYSFSIASHIALKIEKELHVEIQDSEIAYLAYHIQVILDSRDKKKIKTIILYSRSYERTKILSSRVATYFDELEISKIEKFSKDYVFDNSYLYIGINLAFEPQQINAKFIMIQSGFPSSDIKKIRFFLEAQNSIIEQSSIHWINESSPDDAIHHLLSLGNQEHFYEPIMKRERMSYTSIGNLVAIPHPYFEVKEYKESVIIGINKKAIQWGGKELVQLIIIYIPALDIERNEFVFTEFFEKTKNIENVKGLVHTTTKKEFISRWNQF